MLTSRLHVTLAHIAKQPRRIAGLSHNDFYVAQSLYMQELVYKRFTTIGDKREECYHVTPEGLEELKQYELRRSHPNAPTTEPAA